jgi:hypothetical protein
MKKPPVVEVTWRDAAMSSAPHWNDGNAPSAPRGKSLHRCTTVGYLVHLDKHWCQLVATLADNAHAHVTEIPRGMISRIVLLVEGDVMSND